jgi:hypothetical protein
MRCLFGINFQFIVLSMCPSNEHDIFRIFSKQVWLSIKENSIRKSLTRV